MRCPWAPGSLLKHASTSHYLLIITGINRRTLQSLLWECLRKQADVRPCNGRARPAAVAGGRLMDFENNLAHDSSRASDWSGACGEPSGVTNVCAEIETVRARFNRVVLPHL